MVGLLGGSDDQDPIRQYVKQQQNDRLFMKTLTDAVPMYDRNGKRIRHSHGWVLGPQIKMILFAACMIAFGLLMGAISGP